MPALQWHRTVIGGETAPYDFSAMLNGQTVGRITRHHDLVRWSWAWQVLPGRAGVVNTKAEAIAAIKERAAKLAG